MNSFAKKAAVSIALVGGAVAFGGGQAFASADADAVAAGSPGVLSGNVIQAPIHIPVNICGNSINIIGLLNPTFGNTCINADGDEDNGHHDGRDHEGRDHDGRGHEGRGHEGRSDDRSSGNQDGRGMQNDRSHHDGPEVVGINKALDIVEVD